MTTEERKNSPTVKWSDPAEKAVFEFLPDPMDRSNITVSKNGEALHTVTLEGGTDLSNLSDGDLRKLARDAEDSYDEVRWTGEGGAPPPNRLWLRDQ